LLGFIEINHDVAAENDVVARGKNSGLQIVEVQTGRAASIAADDVFVGGLFKVAQATGVVDRFHLRFAIEPSWPSRKLE